MNMRIVVKYFLQERRWSEPARNGSQEEIVSVPFFGMMGLRLGRERQPQLVSRTLFYAAQDAIVAVE
jgi:hypothetical protein